MKRRVLIISSHFSPINALDHQRVLKEFAKPQVFPFFITALILRIIYQVGAMSGYLWLILPSSSMLLFKV